MVQHGQCLCGAVKLTIKQDQDKQVACHCLDCQKASGAPYTSNVIVSDDLIEASPSSCPIMLSDRVARTNSQRRRRRRLRGWVEQIEGKTKSYSSKADSGNMVEHMFCPECGSTIANRSPAYAGKTCFKTGLFGDDFKKVPFGAEIYIKDRFEALKPLEAAQEQGMPSS